MRSGILYAQRGLLWAGYGARCCMAGIPELIGEAKELVRTKLFKKAPREERWQSEDWTRDERFAAVFRPPVLRVAREPGEGGGAEFAAWVAAWIAGHKAEIVSHDALARNWIKEWKKRIREAKPAAHPEWDMALRTQGEQARSIEFAERAERDDGRIVTTKVRVLHPAQMRDMYGIDIPR